VLQVEVELGDFPLDVHLDLLGVLVLDLIPVVLVALPWRHRHQIVPILAHSPLDVAVEAGDRLEVVVELLLVLHLLHDASLHDLRDPHLQGLTQLILTSLFRLQLLALIPDPLQLSQLFIDF